MRKMMGQLLLQIWKLGLQGIITHSSLGHSVTREEVVLETFHLRCLLQDRQGIVTLDMKITCPISWKLVFFARNHSVITETSSCTGQLFLRLSCSYCCFSYFQFDWNWSSLSTKCNLQDQSVNCCVRTAFFIGFQEYLRPYINSNIVRKTFENET